MFVISGCSSVGRAFRSGRRGRRFESAYPDCMQVLLNWQSAMSSLASSPGDGPMSEGYRLQLGSCWFESGHLHAHFLADVAQSGRALTTPSFVPRPLVGPKSEGYRFWIERSSVRIRPSASCP